jgi:serine/threonine protein kinase
MGAVYEAVPFSDPTSRVAIKVIDQTGDISHEVYLRFQKEAALMGQLYHPHIVTFLDLGAVQTSAEDDASAGYFIVMELVRGQNLKELITSGLKKGEDLELLFQIGRQLASALDYTHGKNIIHRDIKPQNIIVSYSGTKKNDPRAKILDFGVAGLLQARQYVGDGKSSGIDDFAGTPLYMAPEQSGMTQWESDHRVDIYSLGCVLFEILMGKPPFGGKSKEDLKLKHISEKPPNLRELRRDIPKALCDLIEKCLEKDPDDRYQSAFSLYCDLNLIEMNHLQPNFEPKLGAFDSFHAINARFPLMGRRNELNDLINFYLSLEAETRSRISVVTGGSGTGKSRIIQEVRNFLVQRKVRFVSGSFSRHDSKISFNALAAAFDEYLLKVMRTQPGEAQRLKEAFKEVLGPSIHELATVIPILGDYREVGFEKSDSIHGKKIDTFTKTFLDFTSCLMSDDQPMVFIFDDIHNADDDSLKLIDDFFTHSNTQRIYLIVTYKEEYLEKRDILRDFVDRIHKLKRRFQHIKLENFKSNEIIQLLGYLFGSNQISDFYLNWIESQTQGNPLQVLELTRSLLKNNKLRLSQEGWGNDLTQISSEEISLLSTDLAISRLNHYSSEFLSILQYAAVAGMSFKAESVAVVSDFERDIVRAALSKAKSDALILEIDYQSYIFSHYEVREALVDGIPKPKLLQIHLDFAVQLDKEGTSKTEQDIFSISHHYNLALQESMNVEADLLGQALRSNIKSAVIAEKRKTYHFALEYYNKSLELIDRHASLRSSDLEYANVLASAARISIKQKEFDKAKERIRRILDLHISQDIKKSALFDSLQMNVLQGKITESLANAKHLVGASKLSLLGLNFARGIFVLGCDFLRNFPCAFKYSSLSILEKMRPHHQGSRDQKTLSIAFRAASKGHRSDAVLMQVTSGGMALANEMNEVDSLDYFLDRVVFLTHLGLKNMARNMLFQASQIEGLSPNSKAKLYLYKSIYFDFNRGEILKSIDYFINRRGYEVLEWPEDGQLEANHRGMSAWNLFRHGQVERAFEQASRAYKMIPVRNQASTFGVAIVLLCLSCRGEREQLVKLGKLWLRRREKSSTRSNDIFALVTATLIYIASGEKASCREMFDRICKEFETRFYRRRNLPHEQDFISFYFIFFPFYFEYEFGTSVFDEERLRALYTRLATGFINPKVSPLYREVFQLLSYDIKADGQEAFDAWLELEPKLDSPNHHILRTLLSTKVGLGLWREFGKLPRINKSILRGLSTARSFSLPLITKAIESKLTAIGISFVKESISGGMADFSARTVHFPTTMAEELLEFVSRADSSRAGRDDLERGAALMELHYGASAIFTVEGSKLGHSVLRGEEGIMEAPPSILEFASGSTTSFIPLSDAIVPARFQKGDTKILQPNEIPATPKKRKVKGLFDETQMNFEFDFDEVTRKNDVQLDEISQGLKQDGGPIQSGKSRMGCLIPIKHWGDVLGYLFVDHIGELYKRDVPASRAELDFFGSILGTSVSLQNSWIAPMDRVIRGPDGSTIIDPCSWLNIWSYGHLRRDRESTWYLGVNLSSEVYLMVYSHLDGKEAIRKRLSRLIWICVHSIISEIKGKNGQFAIQDVYERVALYIQKSSSLLSDISQLNFAVSLIYKSDLAVASAYVGSSKPWVVGGDNNQSAFNDAVATIDGDSKLLRYFHINSSLSKHHPLLLSKDPSKIDRRVDAPMQIALAESYRILSVREPSEDDLHKALEKLVGLESVPRYYLGAVVKSS